MNSYTRDAARAAKIAAVNRCHQAATELYEELASIFAPLVGTKITKADGTLTAKISKILPAMPSDDRLGIHCYMNTSQYSLSWTVKTCEMIEGSCGCLYYSVSVYIGYLDNGVLTRMQQPPHLRSDYTDAEVIALRQSHKNASDALEAARSALGPFDPETDR